MDSPRSPVTAFGKAAAERIEREAASWSETTSGMHAPRLATEKEIPILDLSDCVRGKPGAVDEFAEQLRSAAFETGFYLLKGHGLPTELEEAVFAQAQRFAALREEVRLQYPLNDYGVGHVPLNTRVLPRRPKGNMCTCIYFKREHGPRDITWDRNQWPVELGPEFRSVVVSYLETLEGVAKRLLPAYATLLGVAPDFFDRAFDDGLIRSRLAHYPQVELEEGQYGVGPHVDTTFLTILARREQNPGLCVATISGEWVRVPSYDGHFVINSGELLKSWSNDRIVSTRHYANSDGGERYSIPFFWHPRADYVMDCRAFASCANDEHPAKYPPFSYLDSQGPAQRE